MPHPLNHPLLSPISPLFSNRHQLYWLLGAAGSGKTTICKILEQRFEIPIYDMDAHIYGSYHGRFREDRHPSNYQWAQSKNGLEWLLSMSWEEFNAFNQAALVEYLDLLAEDLQAKDPSAPLLIDGGIWHPSLLAQVLPPNQIVCLARRQHVSAEIWKENEERRGMKTMIDQLKTPANAWERFLEFDANIHKTLLEESRISNVAICTRSDDESPEVIADKVAEALKLG